MRLFLPAVGASPGENRWRDLAMMYVKALVERRIEILLLATPFVSLATDDPWYAYRDLFFGQLVPNYLNVVFGVNPVPRTNVLTGLRRMQAKTDAKRGLESTDELDEPGAVPDLVRLRTHGVTNLAVIAPWPRELLPEEVEALKQYEYVIAPTMDDATQLQAKYGFKMIPAPPHIFAQEIEEMVRL